MTGQQEHGRLSSATPQQLRSQHKTLRELVKPAGVKQGKETQIKIYFTYILCEYM